MTKRNLSPTRTRAGLDTSLNGGLDERDHIIKKLRQELILARNKQKQVMILQNYLVELKQKSRVLYQDVRKKENDIKSRNDMSQKTSVDLKRQIQMLRGQLKNKSIQLSENQASLLQLKRHLAKRASQLQKLKKECLYLKQENQGFRHQNSNNSTRYNDIQSQIIRGESTIRDYQDRISVINGKNGQLKAYIDQLNNQARILKDKLKKYQNQNNNFNQNLNAKQDTIDDLQRAFADQHDQIKHQIDNFIELQHNNERFLTQIRHKINLCKAQNQKSNQMNVVLQKIDKRIANVTKQEQANQEQIRKLRDNNNQISDYNNQMTRDLAKCQQHLQNLMRYNSQIQSELQKYLREDQEVISVIRRKRITDYVPFKESRRTTQRKYN